MSPSIITNLEQGHGRHREDSVKGVMDALEVSPLERELKEESKGGRQLERRAVQNGEPCSGIVGKTGKFPVYFMSFYLKDSFATFSSSQCGLNTCEAYFGIIGLC